ncbi:hypothetical protein ACF0H5_016977 [Mactra antiquata]
MGIGPTVVPVYAVPVGGIEELSSVDVLVQPGSQAMVTSGATVSMRMSMCLPFFAMLLQLTVTMRKDFFFGDAGLSVGGLDEDVTGGLSNE